MPTWSRQPPILLPDVEAELVGWLTATVGVPTSTRVPNPRPDRWVRVMRTGGPRSSLNVDGAQITFEAWDVTSPDAAGLARQVRSVVNALAGQTVGGMLVVRVEEFAGPANLPDPHSETPRYSWTAAVHARAIAAA
jgi:hypothetical protein